MDRKLQELGTNTKCSSPDSYDGLMSLFPLQPSKKNAKMTQVIIFVMYLHQ